ncbi:hypothetical protein EZV73_23935 [Acidaminobacter sp. JC074]|uniref:hypothetical protein n=1 Tax=Acidaminobacter sp. JC074 TaxID=2530199 RepID=UPI001F0D9775|nr:hypothetical protein [Acidaminobacter sp. JC074]MCH4890654.1 hypothetical protein [Acidaminobacter sp. JC074]
MIFNLTGIPGSGKSCLVNSTIEMLKSDSSIVYEVITREDIRMLRKKQKLNRKILEMPKYIIQLFHPHFIRLIFLLLSKEYSFIGNLKRIYYFYDCIINDLYLTQMGGIQDKSIVVLMDESILHLATLFTRDRMIDYVNELMRNKSYSINSNSVVNVFLECSTSVAFERINNRQSGWPSLTENWDEKNKMKYLDDFKDSIDFMGDILASKNCNRILRVNTEMKDGAAEKMHSEIVKGDVEK